MHASTIDSSMEHATAATTVPTASGNMSMHGVLPAVPSPPVFTAGHADEQRLFQSAKAIVQHHLGPVMGARYFDISLYFCIRLFVSLLEKSARLNCTLTKKRKHKQASHMTTLLQGQQCQWERRSRKHTHLPEPLMNKYVMIQISSRKLFASCTTRWTSK